ncbi:MAG: FAD-dependent oxidoreductase, partial [Pseudomonadota bacterium]
TFYNDTILKKIKKQNPENKTQDQPVFDFELEIKNKTQHLSATHLLIAIGRAPNTDQLDLKKANIKTDPTGAVLTDQRLRTSNRKVFAAGDAIGPPQFTHLANYHAGIIIRNILFRIPAKISLNALPWVTYCDPELAQLGMSEQAAINQFGTKQLNILRWAMADNDRAVGEHLKEGFIKVICLKNGRVLGVTIVGHHAGELLGPWFDPVANRRKITPITSAIVPYPTLNEISKRVASSFFTPKLFSERTKSLVRLLLKLP